MVGFGFVNIFNLNVVFYDFIKFVYSCMIVMVNIIILRMYYFEVIIFFDGCVFILGFNFEDGVYFDEYCVEVFVFFYFFNGFFRLIFVIINKDWIYN